MATTTTFMLLTKPATSDIPDVTVLNTDFDLIDSHVHSLGYRPALFTPPAPIVVTNVLADLDAVNLAMVNFASPVTARAILTASFYAAITAGPGFFSMGVRDSANAVVGAAQKVTASLVYQRYELSWPITGMAAGNLTYKLYAITSGVAVQATIAADPVVISLRANY